MMRNYTQCKYPILIFILGIIIFTVNLSPEFIAFQTRFALFAQEMLRNGSSWFPTTYNMPYPDYPVTPTIFIYLIALAFGKLTPLIAIFPTAIASALILVFIYKIAAIQDHEWGLFAVLFALFTQFFIQQSRSISIDQYTTLATIICFYLAYSAMVLQQKKRLWLIPIILIGGFACRGPIGLIIPAGVLCGFYLYLNDYKSLFNIAAISLIILTICLAILSTIAYLQGGMPFVSKVITMQATGRLNRINNSYWYYFTNGIISYAASFPIAALVFFPCIFRITKPRTHNDQLLGLLTIWLIVILAGMSIPATKKLRYILPIVPAISIIAAYSFINIDNNYFLNWIKKIFGVLCLIFPYLTAILIGAAFLYTRHIHITLDHHYFISTLLFMIILIIINIWTYTYLREKPTYHISIMSIAVCAFLIFNIQIASPIQYQLERTKPFTETFKKLYVKNPGGLVFYKIGPDQEDIKFMANLDQPIKPLFANSAAQLKNFDSSNYFITKQQEFDQLPAQIKQQYKSLYNGKIGHRKCILFIISNQKKGND